MLELDTPDGAFERIETYLRGHGFFAPGGEALEADLFLGYGLSDPLRRTHVAAPPEPCPLPLAAVSVRDMRGPGPNRSARDVSWGQSRGQSPGLSPIGAWARSWTDDEYAAMKAHPAIGAQIIERLKFLKEAAQIVKYHHERPDGRGYPDGLRGEEIPFEARILNVCDTLDAMTSTRSYRQALSVDLAVAEFQKYRGSQFDPEVVDTLVGMHKRGDLVLITDEMPGEIYEALRDQ